MSLQNEDSLFNAAEQLTQFPETDGSPPTSLSLESGANPAILERSDEDLSRVTNADFVGALTVELEAGASLLVCTKLGDPEFGGWNPVPASKLSTVCATGSNNYFNCASFRPADDGSYRARRENFSKVHCIVLDDVGTKVPRGRFGAILPSWEIETSPGNFQYGYIFDTPLTDKEEFTQLQKVIIDAGLCDPGAVGVARWARMPQGVNGKTKYKSANGAKFQVRLREWRPEARYSPAEIMTGLGLTYKHNTSGFAQNLAGPADRIADVEKLPELLSQIDPDCGRHKWVNVLMAVHNVTRGSEAGFELVNEWSSQGHKYKGVNDIRAQWRSFRLDIANPLGMGTLHMYARDAQANQPSTRATSFEAPCIQIAQVNPLKRYTLTDHMPELEKQKVNQVLIFGELVLLGQATVIYARPNAGKTLIMLHLIIEAIKNKRIEPDKLIYINMDDNSSGLLEKVRLASEYGFHMVADGYKGFQAKTFQRSMQEMVEKDTARGVIVVLDTLKKFVNTMNKDESRGFTQLVRQFCMKGGTLIALSHTNKNPGADGKVKYTGTTDIVDDFDCAYTLEAISDQLDTTKKVVEFTNIKRRGDVALSAGYSYVQPGSYHDILLSVEEVNASALEPIKQATERQSDTDLISVVEACIASGVNTKMLMIDAVAKQANVSKRAVLKVIEKYSGDDACIHRWKFVVRARGAQVFELLPRPTSAEVPTSDAAELIETAPHKENVEGQTELSDEQRFHLSIIEEAKGWLPVGNAHMSSVVDEF